LQTPDWQQALSDAFTNLPTLLDYLKLDPGIAPQQEMASEQFPLRVPRVFAELMRPGDANDPLLRQVLPLADETAQPPGFNQNPVGDREAETTPGLLHKYRGRALVVATGACAVHCRYCFRRHYPYASGSATPRQWDRILAYLEGHPEVEEVILSGGDPLMVSDKRLAGWVETLAALPRLKRLRLHTRLPVVLPQRVTSALTEILGQTRLQTLVVIHANHPKELSPKVALALASLRAAAIPLLNQSVLLRGVNDDIETLTSLSERLFEQGVMPYYLHLLDRVAGAAHFEVDESRARSLYRLLQARLPGYLVPKLVREIAGECSKTPVA
jgi:EF-P beta-lysylation protein EpmB